MAAIVALAAVLLLGPLKRILAAIIASMLTLLHEADHPSVVSRSAGARAARDQARAWHLLRERDRLYDAMLELVAVESDVRIVVLDARAVADHEYTGLEMLERLRRELARRGIELRLASLNPRLRPMVGASSLETSLFETAAEAVSLDSPECQGSFRPLPKPHPARPRRSACAGSRAGRS